MQQVSAATRTKKPQFEKGIFVSNFDSCVHYLLCVDGNIKNLTFFNIKTASSFNEEKSENRGDMYHQNGKHNWRKQKV